MDRTLDVLFSHFRPRDDGTPQRTVSFKFCPMHVHPRAFVCIFYDKTKIKFPGENHVV